MPKTTHIYYIQKLGVPLYKSQQSLCFSVIIATVFGSFTPLGIALGWILENALSGWITDLLVCIAAGTFMYVSIVEVLIPEFSSEKHMETQVLKENERIKSLKESQYSPFPQPRPFTTTHSAPSSPLISGPSNTGNSNIGNRKNPRTIVPVMKNTVNNNGYTGGNYGSPYFVQGGPGYNNNNNINNINTPTFGSATSITPSIMLDTLKQQSHRQDCLKMTFVVFGFGIMSTLAIWV